MTLLPALGPRGEGWFALQVIVLGAIVAAGVFVGGEWSGGTRVITGVAGAALIAIGLAVTLVAVRNLDRSVSPLPRPVESGELVEHGLYRYVRHPIYAGVVAAAAGWSLATASLVALALCLALAVLLDLKARREELWLAERYAGYADYARRTRRFVPGIY